MYKLICIIGGSCTGKDTIMTNLLQDTGLNLDRLITYTTRPKRESETEGSEYHFVSEEEFIVKSENKLIVEVRDYHTEFGIWHYFTLEEDLRDFNKHILVCASRVQFESYRDYLGKENVIPIIVDSPVRDRIKRYMNRLSTNWDQKDRAYLEMCRRIISDEDEYNLKYLLDNNIMNKGNYFINRNGKGSSIDRCTEDIKDYLYNLLYFIRS